MSELDTADKTAWPLLRSERDWGSLKLGISLATTAAATWCYLIGEGVGRYLGFGAGAVTLIAGSMIGMFILALAVVPVAIRFGVDSIATAKPQFGTKGSIIVSCLQFISIIGWNSLLLIFFAKSLAQFMISIGLGDYAGGQYFVPATTALSCGLVFLFLLRGSSGVDRVSRILVAHVFGGFWMLYLIISHRYGDLTSAVPEWASPSLTWNYATGFELGLITLVGWWPYLGAMVRMAPDGRTAVLPVMLGMGLPVPLLSLIGVAGVLVLKSSDPAEWMRTVGGPLYGTVAILFVTAANLGSSVAGVYVSAVGLRHFKALEKLSWPALLLLTLSPVAIVGVTIPELLFASFGNFMALIGVMFSPLCGIQIADYYVLRRRRIDVRGLFARGPSGSFYFWGGWNPAAIAALLFGFAVYFYLLNPLTYESHFPYQYLTASLPSAFASGLMYILLTRLLVVPRGKGGYGPPAA